MKYAEVRNRIRSGDLLAWTHRGWNSFYDFQVQMVRAFTQSEYSHVGIAWVIGGRVMVIEAVSSGVRIFPLSRLLPCYWVSLKLDWTEWVEETALAIVGRPYDSKLRMVLAFLGIVKQGGEERLQCAEFVKLILTCAGVDRK